MGREHRIVAPSDALDAAKPCFASYPEHWQIASRAVFAFASDEQVLGLYLAGSFAKGLPDQWSDIDLYVVVSNGRVDRVIESHSRKIREVAEVLTSFPATHLGDPHQVIVFYKAPSFPIHVDYQYREIDDLRPRPQDAMARVLLDPSGVVERYLQACREEAPFEELGSEQLQYFEDRFWGWCWYTYSKIRRGELWEGRDALEYIRSHVLVPLAHAQGPVLEGNRRLESKLSPQTQELLARTLPGGHDSPAYLRALAATIDAYSQLFSLLPAEQLARVQLVDRRYFRKVLQEAF